MLRACIKSDQPTAVYQKIPGQSTAAYHKKYLDQSITVYHKNQIPRSVYICLYKNYIFPNKLVLFFFY